MCLFKCKYIFLKDVDNQIIPYKYARNLDMEDLLV